VGNVISSIAVAGSLPSSVTGIAGGPALAGLNAATPDVREPVRSDRLSTGTWGLGAAMMRRIVDTRDQDAPRVVPLVGIHPLGLAQVGFNMDSRV
jgi:hypothetical protein